MCSREKKSHRKWVGEIAGKEITQCSVSHSNNCEIYSDYDRKMLLTKPDGLIARVSIQSSQGHQAVSDKCYFPVEKEDPRHWTQSLVSQDCWINTLSSLVNRYIWK